jgi:hypothetical protein
VAILVFGATTNRRSRAGWLTACSETLYAHGWAVSCTAAGGNTTTQNIRATTVYEKPWPCFGF